MPVPEKGKQRATFSKPHAWQTGYQAPVYGACVLKKLAFPEWLS
jgi:hypothetical protein